MRVLLVNPPYQTITSNLGVGHQVPLGLLMIGGALIDAGFETRLLDAEALHLSDRRIAGTAREWRADIVMTGHAGSTPAHPVCMRMLRRVRSECPAAVSVYGGVFPTYHARAILRDEPCVDVIVRGEGEAGAPEVVRALAGGNPTQSRAALAAVRGIAFRDGHSIIETDSRPPIGNLNAFRTAWELIDDWDRYRCFGLGRAAIVQFSRGCPHRCTYCGQHAFWSKWRHRDPARLADEVAWLHRERGVRFITLADENPTTLKPLWKQFLEEVIARRVDVHFFATIRASDIVRDADFLDVYRRAGLLYILLGIDATDPRIIEQVRKRSNGTIDMQACHLLREHGIRSIIAQIVGLGEETWADFRRARRALEVYDGDLLNMMYATPHSWSPFAVESASRLIVQENQRRWDYRHQVLSQSRMRPWQLFAAVKWLELVYHATPRRLWRLFFHPDPLLRRQLRWTALHTGAVWLGEIIEFLFATRHARRPKPLRAWLRRAGWWPPRGGISPAPLLLKVRAPARSVGARAGQVQSAPAPLEPVIP